MLSFFPLDDLDEIWDLIESVLRDFLLVQGQIRESALKNEYAKHVGHKQFVIFHQN